MLGGVVRISNGVRSSVAVKRLFGSSTALRSAPIKSKPAPLKCEANVAEKQVDESVFVKMERAYKGYQQRIETDSLNMKDLIVTNVVGGFSVVTLLMWMDLIFG